MISISNFKQVPDWPSYGFMYGENILESQLFDTLNKFNFANCPITDPTFPKRKALSCESAALIDSELGNTLAMLRAYANDFSIIEQLITNSLVGSDMPIHRFWTHGLESIKNLHKNVYIQFVEDEPGVTMAPHADHREVLCNMQIYISPDEPSIGTTFHQAGDYTVSKTVPFRPNCGYFSFNTHLSIHSLKYTTTNKRRSIILSWTM